MSADAATEARVFDQPRYLQSTFTLVFPEQRDLADREKRIYDQLRPFYFPAQPVRMPNASDAEAPWLAFNSQHGHSQIYVAASSVTLNVNYSPDWQTRVTDAREYVGHRMSLVFGAAEVFEDISLLYCGSATRARLAWSASDDELVETLVETLVKEGPEESHHDLILRTTSVVDDLFFNNITVQNYRNWNLGLMHSGTVRLSRTQAVERGVEIIGDFNSRYAFNEDKEFMVTREAALDMINRSLAGVADTARFLLETRQ